MDNSLIIGDLSFTMSLGVYCLALIAIKIMFIIIGKRKDIKILNTVNIYISVALLTILLWLTIFGNGIDLTKVKLSDQFVLVGVLTIADNLVDKVYEAVGSYK